MLQGYEGQPFLILYALLAASVLIVIGGLVIHRRGGLRSRGGALIWALLAVAPLFGAGLLMFIGHSVDQATGRTQSGVNGNPAGQTERPARDDGAPGTPGTRP